MGSHKYTNSIPQTTTEYSGLQIQSTSSCLPITLCWGQAMFSPNIVWYRNFQKHPVGAKGKSGGKSGGKANKSYTYTAAVIMALCEGPIQGIGMILNGSPPSFPLSDINSTLFSGSSPQSVWWYSASAYPGEALPYNGVAYICSEQFDLGGGATVGSYTFEVKGLLRGTGFNGVDADPAMVIQDFLTNPQYGVGFPASSVDVSALYGGSGSSSYQAYCWATGIAISPVLNNREQASAILARWLQITNSTAVWTSGVLRIIPFAEGTVTGNGWTWTSSSAPLYDLTDDDFVYSSSDDPVQVIRNDPYSIANWQSIEIQSRDDYYTAGPIVAQDQGFIDRFGQRVGSTVTAHEICDNAIAQKVIQLILQRGLHIRNTYKFRLSFEFCLLDPMDLVTITDPYIGLNKNVVRITDIEEDDSGILTVTAEDYPQGISGAAVYSTATRSGNYPDSSVPAPAINTPVIFEPPAGKIGSNPELWCAVSGPDSSTVWGGCLVWASRDNLTYGQIASLSGASVQGVTTSSVLRFTGSGPDTVSVLSVDLTESLGVLNSTTAANAAGGITCCYVGGEYIAYTTATLTAANKYDLTGLYRGMYGLPSIDIPPGSPVVLLSGNMIEYPIPSAEIGEVVYLKFQSFNIFNSGLQDLSLCTPYSYSITGTGTVGPVTAALSLGTNLDYGLASSAVVDTDDWGSITDPVISAIDLGYCH